MTHEAKSLRDVRLYHWRGVAKLRATIREIEARQGTATEFMRVKNVNHIIEYNKRLNWHMSIVQLLNDYCTGTAEDDLQRINNGLELSDFGIAARLSPLDYKVPMPEPKPRTKVAPWEDELEEIQPGVLEKMRAEEAAPSVVKPAKPVIPARLFALLTRFYSLHYLHPQCQSDAAHILSQIRHEFHPAIVNATLKLMGKTEVFK